MCGIFAYLGKKTNAAELTLTGLKTLEYRGYDSWGIAIKPIQNAKNKMQNSSIQVEKHIGKIGEARTTLPPSSLAIGHTRWATHGGVTDANAHPHLNTAATIAVVHNGIIENHQELRATLTSTYLSQTDTEVVAHLIDHKICQGLGFRQAVIDTFNELVGSNAIVVMDLATEEIVACRDGSPLVIGIGTDEYILGSDVTALLPYTQDVCFMNDGETVQLSRDAVTIYDTKTSAKKKLIIEKIEWSAETAQKGGHPHYMLKEILEQVTTIPKAQSLNHEAISSLAPILKDTRRILITGCGTAYHCALISKYFFAAAGLLVETIPANEIPPYVGLLDRESILIAISQSGETADTLIAVKAAKAKGARIVAVVNARASTLERIADHVLSVGSGPEIAVVSTKAFSAQTTTMYKLANQVKSGKSKVESQVSLPNLHELLVGWLTPQYLSSIQDIATRLLDSQDIYVIGRYTNYPAALETALKIKEASYIHAEGFASGELKHGVISLIQKGTPCIVLADEGEGKREILSSATELKTRGGLIIGISPKPALEYDIHVPSLDIGDLTALANVIVGQLLGYYLSVGRGCDPDKPRNLAKSVTVK